MDRIRKYQEQNFEEEQTEFRNKNNNTESQSPTSSETMEPKTKKGIIANSGSVNVRSKPTINSEKIAVLDRGAKVEIIGKVGEFYKIRLSENSNGFVHSSFCQEE